MGWVAAAGLGAGGGALAGFIATYGRKSLGAVAFVALLVVMMAVKGSGRRLLALGFFGAAAAAVAAILQR